MVIKVYISGISGNKEVKKRQQRVLMILDSRVIKYEVVDIAEPDNEAEKDFMQSNSTSLGATVGDANPRHPLPPQLFNDKNYCGDYEQFDMANEIDNLDQFLKLSSDDSPVVSNGEPVVVPEISQNLNSVIENIVEEGANAQNGDALEVDNTEDTPAEDGESA